MGLRTNAVFIGLAAALYSSLATALGLGEIKLHSALNQPLDAEIQLLHVRDLTEQEIVVGLASPRDFERAGVEREFFLTNLDFDVDLDAQGGPVVRLRSENPVREPFLNFIVTAEWPSGKLLREYTLLVDLPLYAEEKPAEVQAAQRQTETRRAVTPEPSSEPVSRPRQPSTVSRPAAPREAYDMEEYGPVGANENLWSIANRLRPDSDVSVQQTMLAIQRLNPDAFINNNINLLRRGQVLRVPGKDDIQSLTARDAIREVAAQNQAWSDRTTRTDRSAQLEGSKRAVESPRTSTPVEGRIKLSSADDRDASTGVATGDGDTGDSAIKEELSVTQEELDAASRENAELKSRIQAIEEQIATMERLVSVSNDELRALEMAAQQANEAQTTTDETSLESDTPEGEAEDAAESVSPVEQVAKEQQQAKPVEDPPKPAPRAGTPQQASWLDWVKDNLLYVAGGLGALVVLLAVYLFMRNREEEFDDFDDDEFTSQVEPFELDDHEQGLQDEENGRNEEGYSVGFDEADATSEATEEDVHIEPETEDVVGECDIHIAYGQYDQAEEKLVRALDKDPENIATRMKLLEVFTVQGDIEGFDSHYAKLRAIADQESIAQAEAMREGFQDAPDFDESLYDTGAFLAGLSASGSRATSSSETPEETFEPSGDTVNFDFDEEGADSFESDSESAASDDSSLEFDLDFEDDDATLIPEPVSTEAVSNEDDMAADDLSDLDTDFESIDFDLDSDDLEVGLDLDEEQQDQTRVVEPSESPVAMEREDLGADFDEFDVSLDESEVSSLGDGFDDFDAQLEDRSGDLTQEDELEDFAIGLDDDPTSEKTETLDFDLDRDLEDAMASKEKPEKEASFDDLELNELDDALLPEDDLSGESDLPEAGGDREEVVRGSESDVADEAGDFDLDYDLDADVNLDELDQELGELDLEDEQVKPSAVTPQMEEPEVDFGETESLAEPETEEVSSEPVSPESKRPSDTDDVEIPDFDPENDDDSSLEFLSENDETATKLDLARAYIDMGDAEGAKDILDEITEEGNDDQKKEAETLLSKLA